MPFWQDNWEMPKFGEEGQGVSCRSPAEKAPNASSCGISGLMLAEAAAVGIVGISVATAKRHWVCVRAWLLCESNRGRCKPGSGKQLSPMSPFSPEQRH